jgi:small-conductance mechanosensitive channel
MESAQLLFENARDPHILFAVFLVLASITGLVVHRLGRPVLMRICASMPVMLSILKNINESARYVLPLLFMLLLARATPNDLTGVDSVRHLLSVLLILGLTWLLIRTIKGVAEAVTNRYPLDVDDNLNARRIHTQTRVLMRASMVVILIVGLAMVLMTFPSVRTIGASLLASAGVVGLAIGMAARPVLENLIAGIQIALTQPIRLDDVLIVEGEWGRVEEITGSYVVLRIWDRRRLIIPLQWFIANPFQNWTRQSADIIGTVFWWVDYRLPLDPVRAEIQRLCEQVPHLWDGELAMLVVVDSGPQSMQLRALVTARSSGDAWDLRCHVREGVVNFIQREYPQFLPRLRADFAAEPASPAMDLPAAY